MTALRALWLVVPALLLAGCKDNNPFVDGGSPSNVVFPSSNVSYSKQVQVLFDQACSIPSCHDDGTRAGGLSLTTWGNAVVGAPTGTVIAGDPAHSYLVLRIEGALLPKMPPTQTSLNQNQVQGITTWVKEGAKAN